MIPKGTAEFGNVNAEFTEPEFVQPAEISLHTSLKHQKQKTQFRQKKKLFFSQLQDDVI